MLEGYLHKQGVLQSSLVPLSLVPLPKLLDTAKKFDLPSHGVMFTGSRKGLQLQGRLTDFMTATS